MADLLKQGSHWLEQMRTTHMSSPVIYRRVGHADIEVQATIGKTDYEVADEYGATIRSHVVDFLILADDLDLEPQAGDVIVTDGRKYEVMDLAGEGSKRWSDSHHTTYRIHTKDTGVDT